MPIYDLEGTRPRLPKADSIWIAPDAHIIGDVELGNNVGIWFGTVLRGDNEPIKIGAGTNVQEGVMIHADPGFPATIGEGCTIGHHAIVHGCRLGANTLVGMGATILNGAEIGENCLIGANALVTEGKKFEPGSLIVGAPAKAVRVLDPETISGMKKTAENYVRNLVRFKNGLSIVG
jgi:carbonic anhydrase/acetyltransferase-like protein (isoleucine patch superfamily)